MSSSVCGFTPADPLVAIADELSRTHGGVYSLFSEVKLNIHLAY